MKINPPFLLVCQQPLVRHWEEMMCVPLCSTRVSQRGKQVTSSLAIPSTFTCSTRRVVVVRSWCFPTKRGGSSMERGVWKHQLLLHARLQRSRKLTATGRCSRTANLVQAQGPPWVPGRGLAALAQMPGQARLNLWMQVLNALDTHSYTWRAGVDQG